MKNITIIIASYNKPLELKKKILLYKDSYPLLILDRSNFSIANFCKENLNKYSKYLYYPNKTYLERMIIAKKFIKTKYITIQNDDDYYLPNYIEKSINFLDNNRNYSCVGGYIFSFRNFLNNIYLERIQFKMNNVTNLKYQDRVKKVLRTDYANIYHGVMRSSVFKDHADLLKKNLRYYKDHLFWVFHEEMTILIALNGKVKILNQIFCIRNADFPRRIWPEISHQNFQGKLLKKFVEGYLNYWLKNILIKKKINNNKNFNFMKKEFLNYLSKEDKRKKKRYKTIKHNFKLIAFLINLLPIVIRKNIYFIIGKYGDKFNRNWLKKNRLDDDKETFSSISNLKNYFSENYLKDLINKKNKFND